MKSNWLTKLDGKETLWIRVPGFIVGLLFILMFPLMAWSGHASILSAIGAVFIGIMFVAYGLGGSRLLLKVMPSTYVRKL